MTSWPKRISLSLNTHTWSKNCKEVIMWVHWEVQVIDESHWQGDNTKEGRAMSVETALRQATKAANELDAKPNRSQGITQYNECRYDCVQRPAA